MTPLRCLRFLVLRGVLNCRQEQSSNIGDHKDSETDRVAPSQRWGPFSIDPYESHSSRRHRGSLSCLAHADSTADCPTRPGRPECRRTSYPESIAAPPNLLRALLLRPRHAIPATVEITLRASNAHTACDAAHG